MSDSRSPDHWELALVQQVQKNSRLFFRLAFRILRDPAASEDVCQQAFMKAWRMQDRLRDPVALQAWLMRVVVNESLQVLRARKVRMYEPANDSAGGHPDVSALERDEFRQSFHEAVAELPDQTQTVLMLRLVEGLSGNEVKSLLGCGASEISRRLHHGLDHLRQRLGAAYPNGMLT